MNWTKIGLITGAIMGVISVAGVIGFTVDRPAWHSELIEVVEDSVNNREAIFNQRQQYIDDRRDRYKDENKPMPKWLKDRQRQLDNEKRRVLKPKK